MKKRDLNTWIKALESGDYEQGQNPDFGAGAVRFGFVGEWGLTWTTS